MFWFKMILQFEPLGHFVSCVRHVVHDAIDKSVPEYLERQEAFALLAGTE
jgi:hypothetical protein